MNVNYKSIIVGIGTAVGLKILLSSVWVPLFVSIILAAKIDKNINTFRGMIYGIIIGLILTLFHIWQKGYEFGPLLNEMAGFGIMAVLSGAVGALFGKIFKGKGGYIW